MWKPKPHHSKSTFAHLHFTIEDQNFSRFKKAFVGKVLSPGMTYNIQNIFHAQGYFAIKVTPMGANLCLLEEQEEGELKALTEDANEWLEQWFE